MLPVRSRVPAIPAAARISRAVISGKRFCRDLVKALKMAVTELKTEGPGLAGLRDRLEKGILTGLDHVTVNGCHEKRVPSPSSLNFSFLEGEALLMAIDVKGIAVSTSHLFNTKIRCASCSKNQHILITLPFPGNKPCHRLT